MVTALLIAGVVALLVAAAIFLWHVPALHSQRRAAARHAETLLQGRAGMTGSELPSRPATAVLDARWEEWLIRADMAPTPRTLALLALPTLLATLGAAARTGSVLFTLAAGALALVATVAWLYFRSVRLQRRIVAQLPGFLEHMVRIAAVGNSLPMAFQGAAGHTRPPLRPIIEQAQRNTRAGMDIDRALYQAAQVYRVQPLEMVALVMGTSMRIGGRSDQIIQRMADFLRDLEQAQRELSATTSETRMSAVVLGLLPLVCGMAMAMANPEFFNPMLEEPSGRKILVLAALLELTGVALLWRLAKSL